MTETPSLLFESTDYLAVDKPAGWLSIPARQPKPEDRVLSHWLQETLGNAVHVVHRLDRFTSGVMLFAKTAPAHRAANSWFGRREVKKVYHFLAAPPPQKPALQVRTPVDGKPAQTLFEVIARTSSHFYGRALPLTGRFHQIREHAAQAGFPLLGDSSYGGAPAARVCLHAFRLETPVGAFTAPFPPDLEGLWLSLQEHNP